GSGTAGHSPAPESPLSRIIKRIYLPSPGLANQILAQRGAQQLQQLQAELQQRKSHAHSNSEMEASSFERLQPVPSHVSPPSYQSQSQRVFVKAKRSNQPSGLAGRASVSPPSLQPPPSAFFPNAVFLSELKPTWG